MISSVSFVTVNVADQQRAKAFYTEVLGWTLHTDQPMGEPDGARWIEVSPPGAQTRVVLFKDDRHKPSFAPCVFTCEDIEETHREMVEKGVEFTQAPKVEAWGAWWAQFKDSEGNEFGLGQLSDM